LKEVYFYLGNRASAQNVFSGRSSDFPSRPMAFPLKKSSGTKY